MDLVMVPQSPSSALPQAISCKDLIREILSWRHPGTDDSGPEKLINEVGLEASQMANLQASQLSGGMAQRFALALALAAGGRIIILDEPSVGLDANNVEVLTTLIRHIITERNVGVVMLTHDARMRELADTCLQFERRGTIVSVNHRTKVS